MQGLDRRLDALERANPKPVHTEQELELFFAQFFGGRVPTDQELDDFGRQVKASLAGAGADIWAPADLWWPR